MQENPIGESSALKAQESSCPCCCWLQAQLTERALELLALPDDGHTKLLLDLGCGSGLSGAALTEQGHAWVVRLAIHLQPLQRYSAMHCLIAHQQG